MPLEHSSCSRGARKLDFAPRTRAGRPMAAPRALLRGWLPGYQVPLTQPPLTTPGGVHVRVIAPLVRVIENVLPSVEFAVTV